MSNIIPPMLSSTPPPMDDNLDDDDEDEFGDFSAADLDYSNNQSQPSQLPPESTWTADIQTTNSENVDNTNVLPKMTRILTELQNKTTLDEDLVQEYRIVNDIEQSGSKELHHDVASQSCSVSVEKGLELSNSHLNSEEVSPTIPVMEQLTTNTRHEKASIDDEVESESELQIVDPDRTLENKRDDLFSSENCLNNTFQQPVSVNEEGLVFTDDSSHGPITADHASEFPDFQSFDDFHLINNQKLPSLQVSDDINYIPIALAVNFNSETLVNESEFHEYVCESSDALNTSLLTEEITCGDGKSSDNTSTRQPSGSFLNNDTPLSSCKMAASSVGEQLTSFKSNEFTPNTTDFQYEDDDEFSDFACTAFSVSNDEPSHFVENEIDDGCWANVATQLPVCPSEDSLDDDFDNFESASLPIDDPKQLPSLCTVVATLFPGPTSTIHDDYAAINQCIVHASLVWGQLQDVDTSNALTYQWANSAANKLLLTALGIDARNILFGPKWNVSVPRFAANLGISPLEPVPATSVPLVPTLLQHQQVVQLPNNTETFPDAQFDWNSSGLVNPLDYPENEGKGTASGCHGALDGGKIFFATTVISSTAARILDTLPDLSFVRAESLVFPPQRLPHSLH